MTTVSVIDCLGCGTPFRYEGRPPVVYIGRGNDFCCSAECSYAVDKIKEARRKRRVDAETDILATVFNPFSADGSIKALSDSGRDLASRELSEAIKDISRHPEPDLSGALQHASACLEAVARDITGRQGNLGAIANGLPVPEEIKGTITQLWRYASDKARHGREGNEVAIADAKLVVWATCGLVSHLVEQNVAK